AARAAAGRSFPRPATRCGGAGNAWQRARLHRCRTALREPSPAGIVSAPRELRDSTCRCACPCRLRRDTRTPCDAAALASYDELAMRAPARLATWSAAPGSVGGLRGRWRWPLLQRQSEAVAMLSHDLIEVTLTAKTGHACAGPFAQLLQIAHVRNRGHDVLTGHPFAEANDVAVVLH